MMDVTNRRVVMITRRDPYANSVKPRNMKEFLASRGYEVDECESLGLGRYFEGLGFPVPRFSRNAVVLYLL